MLMMETEDALVMVVMDVCVAPELAVVGEGEDGDNSFACGGVFLVKMVMTAEVEVMAVLIVATRMKWWEGRGFVG